MKIFFGKDSIKKVEADVRAKLNKIVTEPQLLNAIGDEIIKDIQYQTRRGVDSNGERFKATTKAWRDKREKIVQSTTSHVTYSKNRSNLTLTGQLLDSLRKMINGRGVKIYLFGIHYPYKQKYMEYFIRKKKKRRTFSSKTVKGFQTSAGGISYVNTGRSGQFTVGRPMTNNRLGEVVEKSGRLFFKARETLLPRLKTIVIRYIRRNIS